MELKENSNAAYERAAKRMKDLKGFYVHATVYVLVNVFLLFLNLKSSDDADFGMFATPLFWGMGLAGHALSVFGKNLIFGKAWEERKIQELMEKENQRWK